LPKIKKDEAMESFFQSIFENFFARLDGPLHFRFIVQPLIAITFAIIDGIKDAKTGRPAYFWALVFNPGIRKVLLQGGWKSVSKIFFLAVILDVAYQLEVSHIIYFGETLVVAFVLAILPYVVFRGPVNRLARLCKIKKSEGNHA
jgi:hypothetical protein